MAAHEQIVTELLGIFAAEAQEHVQALNRGLLELEEAGDASREQTLQELFRAAHSLKGAARAVNLPDVESLAHELEDLFAALQQEAPAAEDRIPAAYRKVDAIEQLVQTAVAPRPSAPQPEAGATRPGNGQPPDAGQPSSADETVRVATGKLDALMAQVGELVVSRLGAEQRLAEVRDLEASLAQLESAWGQEAGPGRTAGTPAEDGRHSLARLRDTRRAVGRFRAVLDADVRRLSQVTADLEGDVRRARLLPLAKVLDAFPRMVRDLAKDRGKDVALLVEGSETEVDRSVLEQVKDPLVHLVRNSVEHGIEPPAQREAAGKPRSGTVLISAQRSGERLLLEIHDDGAGIEVAQVRQRAVDQGLISAQAAAELPNEEAVNLIFRHGLSTAPSVSELSGRGVGLDAVRDAVERLHGSVSVTSTPREGTVFSLSLPLAVSTMDAVLLEVGRQTFVLPVAAVERTLSMGQKDVARAQGRRTVQVDGRPVALVPMAEVLGIEGSREPSEGSRRPVVVVASQDRRVAFEADGVTRTGEVVAKKLPAPLYRVRNVAGATILGSGEVAVILSPGELVSSVDRHRPTAAAMAEPEPRRATVLVVEDSITTRTLEKNILEAAGYSVVTAGDGLEAWNLLHQNGCDLIVADVEMPRMDGLTLTARVRSDRRFADLPIVLVTSRSSREDRERGVEAGADAYIVKGAFDQERLLDTIGRLL